jgi:hypothetical protein
VIKEDERRILDEVIQDVTERHELQVTDSAEPSAWPLEQVWEVADPDERIPYQQQLLTRFLPLSEDDKEWIQTELERLQ